jgi:hypothetical protein
MRKPIKYHVSRKATAREIEEARNIESDGILAAIEGVAFDILEAVGLSNVDFTKRFYESYLELRNFLESNGCDWESKEGYAARIVHHIWLVRAARGKIVIVHALNLGRLLGEAAMHKHWERGLSVSMGGQKGAAIIRERRKRDDAEIRQFFNEERAKGANKQDAYKAVARRVAGVTARMVRTVITGH